MIDRKKHQRIAKQNKIKELPLLNLYILIFIVLVCIGSLFRIFILEILKPVPIVMMIMYVHQKNSVRKHLVPRLIEVGLATSLVGDVLLMFNGIEQFMIGTTFFLIAHIFYVIGFNIGDQVRQISQKYIWIRRLGIVVVFLMLVSNIYTLFDLFPNRVLFSIYGATLAAMTISAMKRYENTTPYSFGFVLVGGLLFGISDNILGYLKMNQIKSDFGRMVIMLTYYLGQYLIMHGSLHHSNLQHEIDMYIKYKSKNLLHML